MSGTTSSQLPLRTIAHILEYLFWEAPCKYSNTADLRKAPGALPIGHFALLQVLQVNHHWRKPAVWLFYGTAAIVLDPQKQQSTILEEFEHTTDLQRRKARTNIQLLLNSGYAPKTMRLLIYAKSPIPSAPLLADAVEASGFALFEWPGINTLYLYDPWVVGDGKGGDNQWGHDQALARLNRRLALSLPALQNINALSATCDSFGLFSLDDLVAARQPQLRSLEAWGTPPNPMRLLQTQISDPLLPPLELTRLVLRVPDGQAAMEVPRTVAQSLEVLEVGPIAPDAIWSPFLSSTSTDFAHLRCLRLHFAPETTLAPQHGRRHHRHTSSRSSTLEDAVAAGAYPLFPVLQHLELIGYAWNAARFLENFPRAHLRRLCLRDCPIETVEALSLSSFVCLESASIDFICSLDASEMDESRLEDWIEQTLLTDHPSLLSLSVTIPRCLLTDDLETLVCDSMN
ncbi:hypothetical protein GGI07_000861 [Coemansia sp. Benny D115]|nr:hypothetical protein GGI07_000861 [Coemansia sp. Benny D115]